MDVAPCQSNRRVQHVEVGLASIEIPMIDLKSKQIDQNPQRIFPGSMSFMVEYFDNTKAYKPMTSFIYGNMSVVSGKRKQTTNKASAEGAAIPV